MEDYNQLNAFLHLNYIPGQEPDNYYFKKIIRCLEESGSDSAYYKNAEINELIEIGASVLKKIVRKRVKANKTYLVPLSGGLDSRAILAGLIDMGLTSQIITVTMGVPGSLDFEIGSYVAKSTGVKNEQLNLNDLEIKFEDILLTAKTIENCAYLFSAHYHHQIYKSFGSDCEYWLGFLGGELAGQNLIEENSNDWETAVTNFNNLNRYWKRMDLTEKDFNINKALSSKPFVDPKILSYEDQLVLGIRQQYCLTPILLPGGYTKITPFLDDDWLKFILNLPIEYRKKEFLYKQILQRAYPKIYSLKVKNNYGLPLNAPWSLIQQKRIAKTMKRVGYKLWPELQMFFKDGTLLLDFNRGLRERADYKKIIHDSLLDLKARQLIDWLDIEILWKEHQLKQKNHTWALIILASLEFYIKAGRIKI